MSSSLKLYGFRYSPYVHKVRRLLELQGKAYDYVEVAYAERSELAELTGGYIHVPVLVVDGKPMLESRAICEHLLEGDTRLQPLGLEGPIWAYHEFCDGSLEDVLFRMACPGIRQAWSSAWERALFALVKERRYGAGAIDTWQRETPALLDKARQLLRPTQATLARHAFLFGDRPTFADCALFGQLTMVAEADPALGRELGLEAYRARVASAS